MCFQNYRCPDPKQVHFLPGQRVQALVLVRWVGKRMMRRHRLHWRLHRPSLPVLVRQVPSGRVKGPVVRARQGPVRYCLIPRA